MKTNCLNGIDECTNRLLLHLMLGINGIDDLYVLKKCLCDESALENPLARMFGSENTQN
jgi:hypothetical protein